MVCLTQAGNGTVVAYQVVTTQRVVFVIQLHTRQRAFVLALVVVDEDGRDVDAVRAWHTVFTVVAGNVLQTYDALGNLTLQVILFLLAQGLQGTICQQIILQVLHIGHA